MTDVIADHAYIKCIQRFNLSIDTRLTGRVLYIIKSYFFQTSHDSKSGCIYSSQTAGGMHAHLPAAVICASNGLAGKVAAFPDKDSTNGQEPGKQGSDEGGRPAQQSPPPRKPYRTAYLSLRCVIGMCNRTSA